MGEFHGYGKIPLGSCSLWDPGAGWCVTEKLGPLKSALSIDVHVYIYIYICMYRCVYTYIYTYIYVCIYM